MASLMAFAVKHTHTDTISGTALCMHNWCPTTATSLDDVRNILAFNVKQLRSTLSYITREVLFVHMSGNISIIAIISVHRWKYYPHT